MSKVKSDGFIKCFFVALITASLTLAYFIIKGKGVFTVADDFNVQQLTFAAAVWSAIRSGDPGQWVWNLDLGSSLITGFSFYNLGSPFLWISLLFPKGSYPYLAGYLQIIKYVVATMSAYVYIRCVVGNESSDSDRYAIAGALLYAFSGYQTTSLMFHFHDAVAFFPLLLWGIENVDDRSKRPRFILAVFVNCLVNYFCFIQEVIFMILYFVIRYLGGERRDFVRRMLACLWCGLLGVGLASFLFIPNVVYIMGSARTEISFSLDLFLYDLKELLFVIKGMILPGDTMNAECVIYQSQYNSTSCYVPLFGLSLVFAFIKTERSWLRNLTLVLGVASLFPILQSVFLLFTESYQRWWFMFTLILALVTVKVMMKPDQYSVSTGTLVYVVAVILFYTVICYLDRLSDDEPYIFIEDHFVIFCVIAVSGPLLTVLLHKMKAWNSHMLLGLVMFSCILTTALTLHYYRTGTDSDSFNREYQLAAQLKVIDDQYRYNASDNLVTAPGDAAGYAAFTSTIENSSRQFDTMFDLYSTSQGWRRVKIPGLPQLLGARYNLTSDSNAENIVDEVSWNGNTLYVTEQDAFPIGFAINAYMLDDEMAAIPQENRALALMQAAVIDDEDQGRVDSCMRHIDVGTINYDIPVSDMISYTNYYAVEEFERSSHGFACKTSYDSEQMVYFAVPYDDGWTATIDGIETDVVYSGGMMLLHVPEGVHRIIFTYNTPGIHTGIIISLISSILFVIYLFYSRGRTRGSYQSV